MSSCGGSPKTSILRLAYYGYKQFHCRVFQSVPWYAIPSHMYAHGFAYFDHEVEATLVMFLPFQSACSSI